MNGSPRILIVTPELNGPGGVAHFYRGLKDLFSEQVSFLEVGTRYTTGRNIPGPLRLILDVIAFSRKVRGHNVIHLNPSLCAKCFFRSAMLLLISKLFRKKVIVFWRGWPKTFEQKVDRYLTGVFKIVYARADAMIVLAREFEEAIRRWGYVGPVYRETTAVDDRLLDNVSPESGRNSSVKRILYLARVEKAKGIYEAVEAIRRLEDYPVEFYFAGTGNETPALEQSLKENPCHAIRLFGYVRGKEKTDLLNHADIFLFPSYSEGMPNSVLEAMAFGLPIVVTAVGGIQDFFEEGKMGFLVRPRSADDIVVALKKLINDESLLGKIASYNAAYAKEHFYASRVVIRLEQIYRAVFHNRDRILKER